MLRTRSQSYSPHQRPWQTSSGRAQDDRRPDYAPSPLTLPIPGHAGVYYDTQRLSPISAERAAKSIKAGFIFQNLQSIINNQDRYLAFQLHISIAIRVYNPLSQRIHQDRVTCNYRDYQNTQSACAHLYVS